MINERSLITLAQFVLDQLEYDSETMISELLSEIRQLQTAEIGEPEIERIHTEQAAIQRKKEKLLDAFLSEQITSDEMTVMKQKYDRELEALEKQLHSAEEALKIAESQRAGLEEILQTIRSDLHGSEELLRETVESITVFTEYVEIKIHYVSPIFRIWYSTHGKGENYTTIIDRCELVEPDNPENQSV